MVLQVTAERQGVGLGSEIFSTNDRKSRSIILKEEQEHSIQEGKNSFLIEFSKYTY